MTQVEDPGDDCLHEGGGPRWTTQTKDLGDDCVHEGGGPR